MREELSLRLCVDYLLFKYISASFSAFFCEFNNYFITDVSIFNIINYLVDCIYTYYLLVTTKVISIFFIEMLFYDCVKVEDCLLFTTQLISFNHIMFILNRHTTIKIVAKYIFVSVSKY